MRFASIFPVLLFTNPLIAQPPPNDRPWVFLSSNSDEPANQNPSAPIRNVLLRPNVEMSFFVYVRNPTDNPQDVTVVVGNGPNAADALASSTVRVPARTTVRVGAPKTTPPPAGAKQPPPPGGPLQKGLYLRVLDKSGDVLDQSPPLPVRIEVPSQYVEASASFSGEPGSPKNQLKVTVRDRSPSRPFAGPPAHAKLLLLPEFIPGLVPASAHDGTFEGEVPPGGEAILVANNLLFTQANRQGVIVISVDGYERAFLFATDFGGTAPQPVTTPALRLVAPRFAQTAKPVPVRLEIDNPPRSDAVVEFGIDRSGTGNYVTKRYPSGERAEAISVSWGGSQGGLTFATSVSDRIEMINAAGMTGTRRMRLRLLFPQGGQLVELNPPAPIYKDITFDDTPPLIGDLRPMNKTVVLNQPMVIEAMGQDPESGIASVLFFVGPPPTPEGKPAPGGFVFPAIPPTTPNGPFTAKIPVGDAKALTVGVRMTNPLGLSSEKVIELVAAPPPPPKTTGTVKGVVVQGTDERPQPKVAVKLSDPKGMEVKAGATNEKGEFAFEEVPPGKYTVSAAIPRDRTMAKKDITVEAGKTTEVNLSLKR